MTISEQIELLDRCVHNRSGDFPCAFPLVHVGKPRHSEGLSLGEAIRLVETERSSSDASDQTRSVYASIQQGLAQAKLLSESQPCPILAIAGLLNAGKTSLVSGFLSAAGQSRLLIGSSNQQGTHRFVLWLPENWRKHDELWSTVMQQLQTVFGVSPEELASDRETAFRQYNGECFLDQQGTSSDSIAIPLIATDENLDRWGIGLMDCPDVQTGISSDSTHNPSSDRTATEEIESIAESRARMLERALRIASAFVVVTSANSIQDAIVGAILDAADLAKPGLKKVMAVNRVPRRYTTAEIAQEIANGYRSFALWRVYMAYHFDGPIERHRLPSLPLSMQTQATDSPYPVFFRVDTTPPAQPPEVIPDNDFMVTLGSQLDRSELTRELLHSTLNSLHHECRKALSSVERYAIESQRRLERLHQTIAMAALSLSIDETRGQGDATHPRLRLQVSREIVSQIAESLERTAPWWAMPGRKMARWSEQLRQLATDVTKWVAIPSWISDRASSASSWVRSRWRSGEGGRIISSKSYGNAIRDFDFRQDLIGSEDNALPIELQQQIEQIIERFQDESRTRLKDQQLDDYTRETWKCMSWRQRLWTGVAPAGLLFAPLLAVVMVPLDFGGTTVLVFASMKELLFAGMASVGMAMINNDHMPEIAEQEAAWQQLSDLFAISCDAFGIPRPTSNAIPELMIGQTKKRLIESSLPARLNAQVAKRRALLSLHPEFKNRFDELLTRMMSSPTNEL